MREDALIIGWREWVALPSLGIAHVKAKIDTGARTSALHAFSVRSFRKAGNRWVRFKVHPLQRNAELEVTCTAEVIDRRVVSDSGGHREQRDVIATELELGPQRWTIELTLTDRETMLFRMLLGRTALHQRFLVAPGGSYRLGKQPHEAPG